MAKTLKFIDLLAECTDENGVVDYVRFEELCVKRFSLPKDQKDSLKKENTIVNDYGSFLGKTEDSEAKTIATRAYVSVMIGLRSGMRPEEMTAMATTNVKGLESEDKKGYIAEKNVKIISKEVAAYIEGVKAGRYSLTNELLIRENELLAQENAHLSEAMIAAQEGERGAENATITVQQQNASLRATNAALVNEREALSTSLIELQRTMEALQERAGGANLDEYIEDLESVVYALQSENADLSVQIEESKRIISDLRQMGDDETKKALNLNAQNSELATRIDVADKKVSDLEKKLKASDMLVSNQSQTIKQLSDSYSTTLSDLTKERNAHKKTKVLAVVLAVTTVLGAAATAITAINAKNKIAEKDSDYNKVVDEKSDLQETLNQVLAENEDLSKTVQSLIEQNKKLEKTTITHEELVGLFDGILTKEEIDAVTNEDGTVDVEKLDDVVYTIAMDYATKTEQVAGYEGVLGGLVDDLGLSVETVDGETTYATLDDFRYVNEDGTLGNVNITELDSAFDAYIDDKIESIEVSIDEIKTNLGLGSVDGLSNDAIQGYENLTEAFGDLQDVIGVYLDQTANLYNELEETKALLDQTRQELEQEKENNNQSSSGSNENSNTQTGSGENQGPSNVGESDEDKNNQAGAGDDGYQDKPDIKEPEL